MEVHLTARKFKAHSTIREHAVDAVKKLDRFYDGIVRCDIILSYERPTQSVKAAEIILHVFGTQLTAKEKSEDFLKSVELAIQKLEHQLDKYKTRIRAKDKKVLRSAKEGELPRRRGAEE